MWSEVSCAHMGHSDYAPNLFLVAHDSFTGRMEVSRELVLCGLVSAELAHLIVERRLGVADDRIVVTETPGSVRPVSYTHLTLPTTPYV